ncbi:MAG TPA: MBL fold metallo-hydrolase [Candidatus Aphodovivens avistercoris]|nr:MBL fold metallo-hydrolase [Candidatus Aphodovivens avistercoris]
MKRTMYKINDVCVTAGFMVMGPLQNNVYFITDGKATFVVDPSCDADAIMEALGGVKLDAIVLTHRHSDHTGAAARLQKKTGAAVIASAVDAPVIAGEQPDPDGLPGSDPCPVDQRVSDGDVVKLGDMAWRVMLTPGHTSGGICLFLDPQFGSNPAGKPLLISGDTLFCGSIGRTDFAGGSLSQMRASLKKLATLPDETLVLPGHNDLTTIAAERRRVFAYYAS